MRWNPFKRPERRYTEALLTETIDRYLSAGPGPASTAATAAAETARGLLSRSLALAEVSPAGPRTAGITAEFLRQVGRDLIWPGESVWYLDMDAGRVVHVPVTQKDVYGGIHPSAWRYWCSMTAPTQGTVVRVVPSAEVLHFQWAYDPATPWLGKSPLRYASLSAQTLAETEAALRDEAGGTRGHLLPIPTDPEAGGLEDEQGNPVDPLAGLKSSLANLKGNTALVETTQGGWGDGRGTAPSQDWRPMRIGAAPPAALVSLADQTRSAVLGACGVPAALAHKGEGAGLREAWRQYAHATLQPIGALLAEELSRKLEVQVTLNFDTLMASDIQGRARSYKSLTDAGMKPGRAARIVGFMDRREAD